MSPEEIKFFQEAEALIKPVVSPVIEYRLYYNDLGEITDGSMIDHLPSEQYLVVDEETYRHYAEYKVVDKQLKKIEHDAGYKVRLVKAKHQARFRAVNNNAALLLEPGEEYWVTEYYDYRNS